MLSEYNKNGCLELPAIYCFNCSGERHDRMNAKTGDGRCVYFSKKLFNGGLVYDSKCEICEYHTPFREKKYYEQYAI